MLSPPLRRKPSFPLEKAAVENFRRFPKLRGRFTATFHAQSSPPRLRSLSPPKPPPPSVLLSRRRRRPKRGYLIPIGFPFLVSIRPTRRSVNKKGVSSLSDLPLTVLLGPDTHNSGSASLLKPLQKPNGPVRSPIKP